MDFWGTFQLWTRAERKWERDFGNWNQYTPSGKEIVVKADETGMLVFPLGAETHLGTWCHEAPWGSWGLPTHSAALAGGNLSAGFGSSPSINPRMLCTEIKSASSLQRMGSPLPRESATHVQNQNMQGGQMKGRWERTHPSLWSKLANPRALVAERPESYLYHLRAPWHWASFMAAVSSSMKWEE